ILCESAALRVSTLVHFCYASPSKIRHTGEMSLSLLGWSSTMYDLLLKGGTVVDPSTSLHGVYDIAVQDAKIAQIAPTIPREEARRVYEVAGKIFTPGLIDPHAHVLGCFNRNGVPPDLGGVYHGVTTLVDSVSARCATFAGFP